MKATVQIQEYSDIAMGFYDADKAGEPDEEIELDITNAHLASLEGVAVRQTLEVRAGSPTFQPCLLPSQDPKGQDTNEYGWCSAHATT